MSKFQFCGHNCEFTRLIIGGDVVVPNLELQRVAGIDADERRLDDALDGHGGVEQAEVLAHAAPLVDGIVLALAGRRENFAIIQVNGVGDVRARIVDIPLFTFRVSGGKFDEVRKNIVGVLWLDRWVRLRGFSFVIIEWFCGGFFLGCDPENKPDNNHDQEGVNPAQRSGGRRFIEESCLGLREFLISEIAAVPERL